MLQRARLDIEGDGVFMDVVIVYLQQRRQIALLDAADAYFRHGTGLSRKTLAAMRWGGRDA